MIGAADVGKTCLVVRYTSDSFDEHAESVSNPPAYCFIIVPYSDDYESWVLVTLMFDGVAVI